LGEADESETGSANLWSGPARGRTAFSARTAAARELV